MKETTSKKLNWLRAAVLGANDGIVSVASIIVGVAGASSSTGFILTAGVAGLVAGALSMAVGEFISVSTQLDAEKAMIEKEIYELTHNAEAELLELAAIYESKGLSPETAKIVAEELSAKDAFKAHFDAELGINPDFLTDPWHAAYASALSFFCGAIIPIIAVVVTPAPFRILMTFASVIVALVITGALSANAGGSKKIIAIARVVIGGMLAMIVTFGIGKMFGISGI